MRQIQVGFGGGGGVLQFGDGALDFGAAGFGAAQVRVQVARVQGNQRLTFANMVAHLRAHLLDVAHHFARYGGGCARANCAGGFVSSGPIFGGNGRYVHGDRRGLRLRGAVGWLISARGQEKNGDG